MTSINSNPIQNPVGQRTSKAAQEAEQAKLTNKLSNVAAAVAAGAGTAGLAAMMGGISNHLTSAKAMSSGAVMGALAGVGVGAALAGSRVNLPNNQVYEIKAGDTLWDLAKGQLGENASVEDIKAIVNQLQTLNSDIIADPNKIYTGDKIALPKEQQGKAIESISLF